MRLTKKLQGDQVQKRGWNKGPGFARKPLPKSRDLRTGTHAHSCTASRGECGLRAFLDFYKKQNSFDCGGLSSRTLAAMLRQGPKGDRHRPGHSSRSIGQSTTVAGPWLGRRR